MSSGYFRHVIKKAKAEEAAGRPWRAKEIYQGSLSQDYAALEPDFLEAYGTLLDALGDRVEAGKYLFLSGKREDAYRDAIELFLYRTRKSHVNDLIGQFPSQIRRRGLGNLPDTVRTELERRGADPEYLARMNPVEKHAVALTLKDRAVVGAVVGAMILFVLCAFVGCGTILSWAF